jgi:hypothetical protein
MTKTLLRIFTIIFFFSFSFFKVHAQLPRPEYVDSFRNVIVEGFTYNEKIHIEDTLNFIKEGIYSFVNYDQTATFHDIFLCYEHGYNKEIEPTLTFTTVQQIRMIRDIRWLFLFYLDQYVLRSKSNNNHVTKSSRINLIDIKKDDFYSIYGEEGFENVIKLYQQLVVAMNKKSFQEEVVRDRKTSLLEYIGFRWEVKDN